MQRSLFHHDRLAPRRVFTIGALLALLATLFAAASATSPALAAPQAQAGGGRIFIPAVQTGGTVTGPAPSPAPPAPAPPTVPHGGLFLNRAVKTASASTLVDANGGMHAAYVHFTPDAEKPPAVYAYCPGPVNTCANAATWRHVQLGERAQEVQLQLTAAGQPRLLIQASSTKYPGGKDFWYAACDANCADRTSWTLAYVLSSDGTATFDLLDQKLPQRSFALDPQGRPRFVYQDRNYFHVEPDHYGAYYVQCDADCTNSASWRQTLLGRWLPSTGKYELFTHPSLTFTSDGRPRLVANVYALNDDYSAAADGIYYYGCDGTCDTPASWKRLFLSPPGGGSYPAPGWDLELDAQNHPRIAIFTGDGLPNDELENQLFYLECNADDCFNGANWASPAINVAHGDGEGVDLELDAQGRPRLAWVDDGGMVGYAWCNSDCATEGGRWQHKAVDTQAQLKQEFAQAIPPHCDQDLWTAVAPMLALDRAGNAVIAYDTPVEARCAYSDPSNPTAPPTTKFEPVWRAARVTFVVQP